MTDAAETDLTVASALAGGAPEAGGSSSTSPRPPSDRDPKNHPKSPIPDDSENERPVTPPFPLLHNNASADAEPERCGKNKSSRAGAGVGDNDDDEPAVAKPFHRTTSPDPTSRSGPLAPEEEEEDVGRMDGTSGERPRSRLKHKMHKFSLYETASRFYMVGGDVTEKRYRILKIERTADDASELSITDDKTIYSQKDMNQLLDTIDDGNRGTGGLKLRCTTWGLLGFIKFTGPWYMLLITKKSTVAMIGGHYVYQIDGTDLIPLTSPSFKTDQRNTEETRFLGILNNLDLTRSFYYSYSYDITRTLQYNITREREALLNGQVGPMEDDLNSMFVWNNHLLQPVANALNTPYDWCRPIIHGYFDQAAISIYGRTAHVTVIARRSRYFAGARFLKRGANDLGYVANDVETEQIVSESLTTSFHAPGPKFFASPAYTSYVQHRGSIPLYWTQDNTGVTPKPPIELNLVDPFYTAAALHFDNLFERYGAPIYVLNLVKARERTPRESKLLDEFTRAVEYLNQLLPKEKQIIYRAWDMSRAAKSRDQDVIGTLESIAEDVVLTTGFFHNGDGHTSPIRVQNGVARTNCIDCLDRTNAAQFVIGKRALGHQLHALGILEDTTVNYDTDAVNLFTHMYHDHGDTIAVQYGGSQLVNTMETYRKINQWTSHSRDMIESFKRYYNNSFLDGQRQEAYNLFLGNYIFAQGQPMLWDLATDYYLHHEDPRQWLEKRKRHYINWYTPEFLEPRVLPPYPAIKPNSAQSKIPVSRYDDYWLEYYRPSTLSSFLKMFSYRMNSTLRYIPFKSTQEGRYDLSPFRVRGEAAGGTGGDGDHAHDRKKVRKEVTFANTTNRADHFQGTSHLAEDAADNASAMNEKAALAAADNNGSNAAPGHHRGISLQRWLPGGGTKEAATSTAPSTVGPSDPNTTTNPRALGRESSSNINTSESTELGGDYPYRPFNNYHSSLHHHHQQLPSNNNDYYTTTSSAQGGGNKHLSAQEKTRAAQWTFTKVVHSSLNPTVSTAEAEDYARYVSHPHHLPLVVSSEIAPGEVEPEYQEYVNGSWQYPASVVVEDGHDDNGGGADGYDSALGIAGYALSMYSGYGGVTRGALGGIGGENNGNGNGNGTNAVGSGLADDDKALYIEMLKVSENPLTVTEEDAQKKRYKAYRKWLRGKSLFKQQPVD
ncbi:polyphosphoinositide phosphatase [Pseudoneurospora amorphoporcata]|uniref:Polyphosphoinositide phosphatase n=1 Tax=Pseudoneurospora amorphoporcata TaxID=241081 RepID=A0AAN6SIZ3_9PEZI|nr:polyphosphoinositide phosphatase [Pseudoneurospora amorphoporcata]